MEQRPRSLSSFAHRPCTRRCPGTPVCRTLLGPLHISPLSPLCSLEWGHPGRPWVANNYHLKKYIKIVLLSKVKSGSAMQNRFLTSLGTFLQIFVGTVLGTWLHTCFGTVLHSLSGTFKQNYLWEQIDVTAAMLLPARTSPWAPGRRPLWAPSPWRWCTCSWPRACTLSSTRPGTRWWSPGGTCAQVPGPQPPGTGSWAPGSTPPAPPPGAPSSQAAWGCLYTPDGSRHGKPSREPPPWKSLFFQLPCIMFLDRHLKCSDDPSTLLHIHRNALLLWPGPGDLAALGGGLLPALLPGDQVLLGSGHGHAHVPSDLATHLTRHLATRHISLDHGGRRCAVTVNVLLDRGSQRRSVTVHVLADVGVDGVTVAVKLGLVLDITAHSLCQGLALFFLDQLTLFFLPWWHMILVIWHFLWHIFAHIELQCLWQTMTD